MNEGLALLGAGTFGFPSCLGDVGGEVLGDAVESGDAVLDAAGQTGGVGFGEPVCGQVDRAARHPVQGEGDRVVLMDGDAEWKPADHTDGPGLRWGGPAAQRAVDGGEDRPAGVGAVGVGGGADAGVERLAVGLGAGGDRGGDEVGLGGQGFGESVGVAGGVGELGVVAVVGAFEPLQAGDLGVEAGLLEDPRIAGGQGWTSS